MSCRCELQRWQRDRAKQRELAKKTARLLGETQVLYRSADGSFRFTSEGGSINGRIEEIITPY